jgi:hypothetical protein
MDKNKRLICFEMLDNHFKESLAQSFTCKTFLIFNEYLNSECFTILTSYLLNRACNINNIYIVSSNTIGLTAFANQYTRLFGEPLPNIVELPYYFDLYHNDELNFNQHVLPHKKKLELYFSLHGGSYEVNPPQRTLICVNFLQYAKYGHVEFMSQCCDKQQLIDYTEQLTGFCNQSLVEQFSTTYEQWVDPATLKIQSNQTVTGQNSFSSVLRETSVTDPWGCVTEKTMRPFVQGQMPIPLNGVDFIETLTDLGFQFDTRLFDYTYLNEKQFFKRLQQLNQSMETFFKDYTLQDLEDYYQDNWQMFKHNADNFKFCLQKTLDNQVKTILDNL